MADSANIGANFSDYQGNANLGGGTSGVINIDTQPLQQLAAYTMHYKRAVWEQQQADTDAKVKQLSELSNIHLNDLVGKDKDQMSKEFVQLQKDAADYARKIPTNPADKLKDTLDWQTKFGAFMNNYSSGKQRAVAYHTHINTIKTSTSNPAQQEVQLKQLDKAFNSSDIGTEISAMPQFKMESIDVPNPVEQKFNSVNIGGNDNLKIKGNIYNPTLNSPLANSAVLGLRKLYPQKGTPEYDSLSQTEKDKADQNATVDSESRIWNDMAEPLNQALQKKDYIDDNGVFNDAKFQNDNASNSVVMRAYNALKNLDSYSKNHFNEATSGMFNDKGLAIKLPDNINPNDFKAGFIDFAKGVNPNQLVQAGMFAKYTGDVFEKDVTHSGDQRAMDLERMREASAQKIAAGTQAGENYRKGLDVAMEKIKLGWKMDKKGKLAPTEDNTDESFGNLIYGLNSTKKVDINKADGSKIKGVNIKNGSIVDSGGKVVDYTGNLKVEAEKFDNALITEFNKYVGANTKVVDGVLTSGASSPKLKLEDGRYTAKMVNGTIEGIEAEDGSYVTVEQMRHITRMAGQKGRTKYNSADTPYGSNYTHPQPLTQAEIFLQKLKK